MKRWLVCLLVVPQIAFGALLGPREDITKDVDAWIEEGVAVVRKFGPYALPQGNLATRFISVTEEITKQLEPNPSARANPSLGFLMQTLHALGILRRDLHLSEDQKRFDQAVLKAVRATEKLLWDSLEAPIARDRGVVILNALEFLGYEGDLQSAAFVTGALGWAEGLLEREWGALHIRDAAVEALSRMGQDRKFSNECLALFKKRSETSQGDQ